MYYFFLFFLDMGGFLNLSSGVFSQQREFKPPFYTDHASWAVWSALLDALNGTFSA